jgi:hypothetical protein
VYVSLPSIASFHPTSKDSLCGAHGRRFGSMHLFHIYCKIKEWIHGNDTSYEFDQDYASV